MRTNQLERVNGSSGKSEHRYTPDDKMEAIAYGVQVRLDESSSFSRRVTNETVNTARALGVAESIIERWAARRLSRLARETERLRKIRTLLEKGYRDKPDMAAGQSA